VQLRGDINTGKTMTGIDNMSFEVPTIPPLDPATQDFLDSLAFSPPMRALSPVDARAALVAMQSRPTGKPAADIEDVVFPVGSQGLVRVRLIRPAGSKGPLPVVMFFHGGGWILGDANTHDRLARELAIGAHATIALVEFGRAPEYQYPVAIEQAFAATKYVSEHSASLNLDGSRIAIVGDSSGGNIAAGLALLCKQRRGPKINLQVLFYPVTDANFESASYRSFEKGPWLTREAMKRSWNAYLPDKVRRNVITATPARATADQLRDLPEALVVTAECDVLRDEGEAYARKLCEAGVRVTCLRFLGTIHDFVMLNAIADAPAARGAVAQATVALREALQ
jgi:acetyl esterase/lipase